MDFKLVEVTPEMRDKWLHDEIMNKGLLDAVHEQLDEWVSICRALNYQGFGEAMERAENITDLIKKCAELERKHPHTEFIEAVKPIIMEQKVFGTNRKCSKCNRELFPAGRYCPHCGRAVKWDE